MDVISGSKSTQANNENLLSYQVTQMRSPDKWTKNWIPGVQVILQLPFAQSITVAWVINLGIYTLNSFQFPTIKDKPCCTLLQLVTESPHF